MLICNLPRQSVRLTICIEEALSRMIKCSNSDGHGTPHELSHSGRTQYILMTVQKKRSLRWMLPSNDSTACFRLEIFGKAKHYYQKHKLLLSPGAYLSRKRPASGKDHWPKIT
ncbi:hypothetical protein NPIL_232181 [Nephila pilipes]|uniref:Uncharacterized protein n=1 Tax=Nephila pilipes TaxID=299642 RepID=A0A8X6R0L9_NEPPI|nr:hypothetical protein NPIL_232181 [Nephila pilipes]